LIAGVSKGGLGGGGLTIMAVPRMSLVIPPPQAAAIMLPMLCAMDVMGIWVYRKSWSRANMLILIPAACVGIVVGALLFRYMNANMIRLLIGAVALAFTLNWWLNRKRERPATAPNAAKGGFWGSLAGLTSFVAHAGGPPLNMYLLPLRLEKEVLIGTGVIFFAIVNLVKIPPYYWLGQFTAENLWTSVALLPLVPIGMGLGIWGQRRVNERLFYNLCYATLFLAGLKLLYDGVKPMLGFN
jgi:uncharacterized membrane protein YfcA